MTRPRTMDRPFQPRMGALQTKTFHLVGVGGCGMCPLAQLLAHGGAAVTGSDRSFDQGQAGQIRAALERTGVRVVPQDGAGARAGPDAVVISAAVEDRVPDLAEARRLGIPVFLRGQLLADLVEDVRTVAVAGTSGKSTVVAMVGWILREAGQDPMVYNGAPMLDFAGPACRGDFVAGHGDILCTETDESDGTVASIRAAVGVVTNLSRDHKELDELERIFAEFAGGVRECLVVGADPALDPIAARAQCTLRRVGSSAAADVSYELLSPPGAPVRMRIEDTEVSLRLLGSHNAANAASAVAAAGCLGVAPALSAQALSRFHGVERRLQILGERRDGVTVVDDFAHNPAKVAASVSALKPRAARLTLVFQPHGYGPARRMREELADVLATAFSENDRVLLLPIYDAGGTTQRDISSHDLAEAMRSRNIGASVEGSRDDLLRTLTGTVAPGEVILVTGARDPSLTDLARRMVRALDIEAEPGGSA